MLMPRRAVVGSVTVAALTALLSAAILGRGCGSGPEGERPRLSERAKEAVQRLNSEGGEISLRMYFFSTTEPNPDEFTPQDGRKVDFSKRPLTLYLIPGDVRPTYYGRGTAVAYHFSVDQGRKVVVHLAGSGFFDRAVRTRLKAAYPEGRSYLLVVGLCDQAYGSLREGTAYWENIGWGPRMMERPRALRSVLEGDATKAIDSVLARLRNDETLAPSDGLRGSVP